MEGPVKKGSESPSSGRRKLRNDIIFISVLIALIMAAALGVLLFSRDGDTVIVTVDGQIYGEYSLNTDRQVEIVNGEGYNLLVIEGGKAFVKSASCPDGICSSHRAVSKDGESIICLPNKVVIEIRARGQEQPDIIV